MLYVQPVPPGNQRMEKEKVRTIQEKRKVKTAPFVYQTQGVRHPGLPYQSTSAPPAASLFAGLASFVRNVKAAQ